MAVSDFSEKETNDTIKVIRERSAAYTPEWDFNMEQPDMGTVLAMLFADMMENTVRQFHKLPQSYRTQFYNLLGADRLPAGKAKGFVTFSTVNEEVQGSWVKAGEKVLGKTEDGETVTFKTQEDVYVSSARLSKVYYVDGRSDYISAPLAFPIKIRNGENRQSHVFYIGHDVLFCIKTEGEIILDFDWPRNRYGKEQENLLRNRITWSYYSKEGFVKFSDFQYKEGKVYLKKKKEMPPFERVELQGKNCFWLRMGIQNLEPESRIIFSKLSLSSIGNYLIPEIIYDGNMELDNEFFLPFGEHPYPYAEIYFSSEEVFSKKGALINLDFELEFLEYPGELHSLELPIKWRNIMHSSDFKEPEPVDIMIDSVIWEYYNGFGWTRIPDTRCYEAIFRERKEKQEVSVSFICPSDICSFLLSAKESYCIRIRICKMTNLYAMDGIYVVPCMKNLMLRYQYNENRLLPDYAYAVNQLKAEVLKCSREFAPFYNLFPDAEMLYLSFSKPLREEGIQILFVLEKGKADARYRYEYFGRGSWRALKAEDETMHFSRTGMITMYQEHSFEQQEFFGHEGYWIRIIREGRKEKNERDGFTEITGIYMNSATVLEEKESGKKGNLPSGAIQAMERSIGFINKVTNYETITGGFDKETKTQAVKRVAASFRHQGRAVTAKDFEDIVYGGVRNILQVRCFPGRNEKGENAPGHITLAVLPETGIETGRYFEYIKKGIYQYLMPYMDRRLYDENRLHIVEPEWVSMKLYMTVIAKDTIRIYQMREKITRKINAFIDPVTGNFDGRGWKIGILPSVLQIQNVCSQIEDILYIKNISLKDDTYKEGYVLGTGGTHEIDIIRS